MSDLSNKKNIDKKNEMINRILQLMREQQPSADVQRINQGILRVRAKHTLAPSAKELQESIFIKEQTYFALYAKIRRLDSDQFMLEYESSFERIRHVHSAIQHDE